MTMTAANLVRLPCEGGDKVASWCVQRYGLIALPRFREIFPFVNP